MSSENKFPCVLCSAKLSSKQELQEHFRKHANKEIDAKGKPDDAIIRSTSNPKIVEKEKNKIICDICSMEFESVTLAIQHKFRKHPEDSVKHYCPFCGMQFPLKFTKDKHVETHKGMSTFGSFPCSECGVIFHNTKAQNYHFKSTHKRIMAIFKPVPTPPPSKKIKINNAHEAQSVYYCYLCGMEYIIKFNLQKHLESSHKAEERNKVPENLIKCTTCDALFYNKKAYDNHNMYHRPDDLYVSSEEQRLQTVTKVDQDFDIRRVQTVTDKFIPVDKPKRRRRPDMAKSRKNKIIIQTDDELSPISSIDSSESESETSKKTNVESTKNKPQSLNMKTNELITAPGNSKQNTDTLLVEISDGNIKKITNPDIFLNLPVESNDNINTIPTESQDKQVLSSAKKNGKKEQNKRKSKVTLEAPTKKCSRNKKN